MPDQDFSPAPLVPFICKDKGHPYLAGSKCGECGHVFVGQRTVCANCTARENMQPVRLAERGKVYVYTIVHRSFPGVETPFIDVIVDLDDGAHIKGTLLGVPADPEFIPYGLPVRIVYHDAVPAGGSNTPYLTYAFEPINTEEELQS